MNTTTYKQENQSSGFVCPDYGGALWEVNENGALRFRCRVGDAYSTDSIVEAENDAVERALWAAVRALEESAAISRRVASTAQPIGGEFERRAEER